MPTWEINLLEVVSHLYHLVIAYLLAVPIGWDREMRTKSAGLRTFPLVSVAACGYMLTALYELESDDAYAKVMYGILTGIGFIGGGAILRDRGGVTGTATAASLWNTGAIGMAVAWHRFEIAIILSLLNFVTLRYGVSVKRTLSHNSSDIREGGNPP